jgi:curved DNA-binding protein
MENFRNYYELLGVERNSPPDEIKKAFRRLARQYHPDLNQGDKSAEEKFKEFNEAYRVLSDPAARSQYDQFTRFWRGKKNRNNQDFWNRPDEGRSESRSKSEEDFSQFGDFNSFIDQLLGRRPKPNTYNRKEEEEFGSSRRGRTSTVEPEEDFRQESFKKTAPPRPKNVEAELRLPLEKAYQGGRERIKLEA